QVALLDAHETLAHIAPGGELHEERLQQTVAPLLDGMAAQFADIRACGEVVDLLVRAGRIDTAAQLERALNRHMDKRPFRFLCRCSWAPFEGHVDKKDAMAAVCGAHTEFVGFDDGAEAPKAHVRVLADLARECRVRLGEMELQRQLDLERSHLYEA